MAGLGEDGVLTVVGGFEFGGQDVAVGLVESPVVEPVDVFESDDLDLLRGAPGPAERCRYSDARCLLSSELSC